jgi:hypothetical protein
MLYIQDWDLILKTMINMVLCGLCHFFCTNVIRIPEIIYITTLTPKGADSRIDAGQAYRV